MKIIQTLFLALLLLCGLCGPLAARDSREAIEAIEAVNLASLPPEARDTLALIKRGGPFPYRRDGLVFQNRERRLPERSRGYYREYTVPTPGARDRGARRIVTGKRSEYYYTADHYRSFQRIQP